MATFELGFFNREKGKGKAADARFSIFKPSTLR